MKKTPLTLYDPLFDSLADGVFSVDLDFKINSFNRAAEEITGINRENAIGKPCCYVFKATICENNCALKETLKTGKPIIDKPIHIITFDGRKVPVSISTSLLKDKKGNIIGGVETFRDLSIVFALRKELEGRYSFDDIISRNPIMHAFFSILPEIAISESTVLISGESGTGKELFAKAIHSHSNRKNEPFVPVNCGAIPETLLESELFGYKKGAFTGAIMNKPGRFAAAEKGTLFLDEIGDLPLPTQVKLLRVLEDKEYLPLGATKTVKANVRIIAASNRPLIEMLKEGSFRDDLYYRINVLNLELPPLRDRKEDIPLLINHFIKHFNSLQGKNIREMEPAALIAIMNYSFPGNVRELRNIIEGAFILCKQGFIEFKHLPLHLQAKSSNQQNLPIMTLKAIEKTFVLKALERHKGNHSKAAKELGIHRSTLYRKLEKYSIEATKE